jgi:predicted esterase
MTFVKYRFALLGLALAALFVPALAAIGPSATAAAQPAANSRCGAPVMFGLHGMGEGPSGSDPKLSAEISDFDAAQNIISGAVLMDFVPYPTVKPSKWDVLDAINKGPLTKAVKTGESHLQSYVATWAKGCKASKDKIALVGYSMGAWVINEWLKDNPKEWRLIKAVVLYGDPCWRDGPDRGLARFSLFGTCSPAKDYPYPAAASKVPFQTESYCLYHDPVCGDGYGSNLVSQLNDAINCVKNSCPHLHYTDGAPDGGLLMDGAKFVVQRLMG